jgi:hypothetical protein
MMMMMTMMMMVRSIGAAVQTKLLMVSSTADQS